MEIIKETILFYTKTNLFHARKWFQIHRFSSSFWNRFSGETLARIYNWYFGAYVKKRTISRNISLPQKTEGPRLLFITMYSVNHQSGLQRNTFSKLSYFFNTSKCAAYYVISFEVYYGFIGQKILKLWRQERRPFGPG